MRIKKIVVDLWSDNVFSLCVRAGLGVLSCQPALMPNRSTKLELTTSARMTQNECWQQCFCRTLN